LDKINDIMRPQPEVVALALYYKKGEVLESLPIYWGNCEWVRDPSGFILPFMGILPDNPKWIDYDRESKRSVSRDLLENEHPDRPFRTILHKQILHSIMTSASPVPDGVKRTLRSHPRRHRFGENRGYRTVSRITTGIRNVGVASRF
jgi:hypothetical protein